MCLSATYHSEWFYRPPNFELCIHLADGRAGEPCLWEEEAVNKETEIISFDKGNVQKRYETWQMDEFSKKY